LIVRHIQHVLILGICHEIRNPIQGIVGNCDVLHDDIKLLDIPTNQMHQLRSHISSIQSCAQYQKIITDDVLFLSKLELKEVILEKILFNPADLIKYVIEMFSSEAHKKGLSLTLNIDHVVCAVIGDCNLIRTALVNLIANAVKFTQKGSITISFDYARKSNDEIELKFVVQDTGCGMTEGEMTNIFNRFAQATQRTYSEFGGSGLGLFICKNIARTLGGELTVESKKDAGTTFTFTAICVLASEQPVTEPTLTSTSPASVSDNMRILVVEDTIINQKVLVKLLEKCGCSCMAASDGIEALEMFNTHTFDLILMDVAMPRMDGLNCTRIIREIEDKKSLKRTPIIGLSGNVRQEHHDMGLEAGMTDYLTKPIRQAEIMKVIQTYKS
jgi:CheY-like chemotaxis protein